MVHHFTLKFDSAPSGEFWTELTFLKWSQLSVYLQY